MDNIGSTITGVLLGGAITIISGVIPKIIDYCTEDKKHKQSIEKLYFENKLKVLQAYVATLTQLSASMFHNVIATEQLKEIDFFRGQTEMQAMVSNNIDAEVQNSKVLVAQLSELSSAASMFVDIKNDPGQDYELLKSIHVDISKMQNFTEAVFTVINKYNLTFEKFDSQQQEEEYTAVKRAYLIHVQKIADNYNEMKTRINLCIADVRADVKTFKV